MTHPIRVLPLELDCLHSDTASPTYELHALWQVTLPLCASGSLFFLEGEIVTGAIIYRLMTAANGLARWSGTGKEYNWKLGDKEVGEKRKHFHMEQQFLLFSQL